MCPIPNIEIIQGDTCNIGVYLKGDDLDLITEVYLSNKTLGICQSLQYNETDDCWDFYLSPEQTKNMKTGYSNYDITVKFSDSSILTPLYRSSFVVKEKTNEVMFDE